MDPDEGGPKVTGTLRLFFIFFFYFFVDDDSGLSAIRSVHQRPNIYDHSGHSLLAEKSLYSVIFPCTSRLTMTLLVYLMTMPSYGYRRLRRAEFPKEIALLTGAKDKGEGKSPKRRPLNYQYLVLCVRLLPRASLLCLHECTLLDINQPSLKMWSKDDFVYISLGILWSG
jgi:hypothetical protein